MPQSPSSACRGLGTDRPGNIKTLSSFSVRTDRDASHRILSQEDAISGAGIAHDEDLSHTAEVSHPVLTQGASDILAENLADEVLPHGAEGPHQILPQTEEIEGVEIEDYHSCVSENFEDFHSVHEEENFEDLYSVHKEEPELVKIFGPTGPVWIICSTFHLLSE